MEEPGFETRLSNSRVCVFQLQYSTYFPNGCLRSPCWMNGMSGCRISYKKKNPKNLKSVRWNTIDTLFNSSATKRFPLPSHWWAPHSKKYKDPTSISHQGSKKKRLCFMSLSTNSIQATRLFSLIQVKALWMCATRRALSDIALPPRSISIIKTRN